MRRSGRLLRYLDARYVARDMERVRRALRDGKLNFLGLSYGTLIGQEYANLYPRRIRTMALDGLLNHDVPELEAMSDEGAAYERALNRFFAWCDATPGCALYGKGAQATWARVIAKATAAPIPAPGCSEAPDAVPEHGDGGGHPIQHAGAALHQGPGPGSATAAGTAWRRRWRRPTPATPRRCLHRSRPVRAILASRGS